MPSPSALHRLLAGALLLLALAPGARAQSHLQRADGSTDARPYVALAPVPDRSLVPRTLTHSASQAIEVGASIACAEDQGNTTTANHYYRVFDLAAFGVTTDFAVSSVDVGVETATSGDGTDQPISIFLHTLSGPLDTANLTPLDSADFVLTDGALALVNFPVEAVAPAGSVLVVEVFTPDGRPEGNAFYLGANSDGQTGPSYLAAPDCDLPQPTDLATVGYPDVHFVMNVNGDDGTVGTEHAVPGVFALSAAYPNPFNPTTSVTLSLVQPQAVRVAVVDALGREVRTLHDGRLGAGATRFSFEATGLPSGRYLLRVTGETFTASRAVTLLK